MHGLRDEIDTLRDSFIACQKERNLLTLIHQELKDTMHHRGERYFYTLKEESSKNKFIIEKCRQDALNRLKLNPLYSHFNSNSVDGRATWDEYLGIMENLLEHGLCRNREAIGPDYDPSIDPAEIQPNEFWEFYSCAVQLRILDSIKKGDTVPPTFQPAPVVADRKPHELFDSQEAEIYWNRLIEKGYLDENRMPLPGLTKTAIAYIALKFNEKLRPEKRKNREWQYFENLWNLENLRQKDSARDIPPREAMDIDKVFNISETAG